MPNPYLREAGAKAARRNRLRGANRRAAADLEAIESADPPYSDDEITEYAPLFAPFRAAIAAQRAASTGDGGQPDG